MGRKRNYIPTGVALFIGLTISVCSVAAGYTMFAVTSPNTLSTIDWVMIAFVITLVVTLMCGFVFQKPR